MCKVTEEYNKLRNYIFERLPKVVVRNDKYYWFWVDFSENMMCYCYANPSYAVVPCGLLAFFDTIDEFKGEENEFKTLDEAITDLSKKLEKLKQKGEVSYEC